MRDKEFWIELQRLIDAEEIPRASDLVGEQMLAWQEKLERVMDKLTHNASPTVH
jgi:hypothetical protein